MASEVRFWVHPLLENHLVELKPYFQDTVQAMKSCNHTNTVSKLIEGFTKDLQHLGVNNELFKNLLWEWILFSKNKVKIPSIASKVLADYYLNKIDNGRSDYAADITFLNKMMLMDGTQLSNAGKNLLFIRFSRTVSESRNKRLSKSHMHLLTNFVIPKHVNSVHGDNEVLDYLFNIGMLKLDKDYIFITHNAQNYLKTVRFENSFYIYEYDMIVPYIR